MSSIKDVLLEGFKHTLSMTLSLHLIGRCLLGDLGIDKVVEVGGEAFEGEVRVLCQHICSQIIVVMLDVEQQQIREGLCRVRSHIRLYTHNLWLYISLNFRYQVDRELAVVGTAVSRSHWWD